MQPRRVFAADLPTVGLTEFVSQLLETVRGVSTYSHSGTRIAVALYEDEFLDVNLLVGAGFVEYPLDSDPCDIIYRPESVAPLG